MELEDSSGADRVTLPMQLHFFCLSILRLQGTASQEVNAVRETQLPALSVSFKVHHQGLKGVKKTDMSGHTQRALKEPTRGITYIIYETPI